jgi:GT2 family glycosyltransferase
LPDRLHLTVGPRNVLAIVIDLTIVIGNLGQVEHLRRCLKSLFGTEDGETSMQVIVGFNFAGNDDGPQAIAREYPQVVQLRAPTKLGYCRAYNQLIARCASRYVLLLDDDTVISPGTISGMVKFMDAHSDVGIAGCRTVNPDGSYQKTTAKMYSLATELANVFRPAAFWRDGIDPLLTDWRKVGWLNAHFLLVRSEVIDQVGVLDENYYTFQLEADWCLRIRRAGWQVAYVPNVEVMHVGGAHSVVTKVKSYDNLLRSHIDRYYFMRKHYGPGAQFALRIIMTAGSLLRLLKYAGLWIADPDRRPESGPKIRAYIRIALLGFVRHPGKLPESLRRQHADFAALRPTPPT